MPSFASGGGPSINTGNASWDQGLSSIFSFMDPSRAIQAGYYGAEARKAQLEGVQIKDKLANAHLLQMYSANPGGAFPPRGYAPDFGGTVVTQDPYAAGGASAQPAPPAPAPAAAAAPAMWQPSLGTVVASSSGPVPDPMFRGGGEGGSAGPIPSPVIGVGPSGGALIATPISPEQAAAQTPAIVAAHPTLTQGTPPAASSPAPGAGAPITSNATGSDGSVPDRDPISGIFHPGSVMEPGGGRKIAGPAAANGSPAPIAPQLTEASYVATAIQSGQDAAQAQLQWRSYIQSLYDRGVIGLPAYHQAMGSADPSIINTDTTNAANIARTGMEVAGRQTVAGMEVAGRRDIAGLEEGGRQTRFEQTPLSTQGVGPGGAPTVQYPGQTPQGAPVFNQGTALLDNAQVEVTDGSGRITTTTFKNARENNLQLTPKSVDQMHALAVQAGMQGNLAPAAGAGAATIAMTPPGPMTQQEQIGSQNQIQRMVGQQFAPSDDPFQRNMPAQLHPNAAADVMVRAQELYNQRGPTYHNAATSTATALQELQNTGHIPTKIQYQGLFKTQRYIGGDPGVASQVMPGGSAPKDYYVVPQLKPYEPGAIDVAPPGTKEGDPVRAGNMRGVVHNGFVYPVR